MTTQTKLTTQEKARLFHQFAGLLNSGMSIQQSLSLVGKDMKVSCQNYLKRVASAVAGGQDLTSALAIDSSYLDSWTISLIRLSEYSGSLSDTFQRLAVAAEHQLKRERLYNSLRIATIATIWSLLLLIVAIFKQHPSGFVRPIFWLNALGLALLLIGVSFLIARYPGRLLYQLTAGLPGFGKVMQARTMLYFAELELPLRCGMPILTAVDLIRSRIPDPILRDNLSSAARAIRAGRTLSSSLQGKLPPIALQLIHTGEETGNLDDAFQRISDYYEGELERSLRQLMGILRPISFLAIGALIAVLGIRIINSVTNSLPG